MEAFRQYMDFAKSIRSYLRNYGGVKVILYSPLLHFSLLLTSIFIVLDCMGLVDKKFDIFQLVLYVVPPMLGFTLAAYAAIVSFGSGRFLETLAGDFDDGKPSPMLGISAAFLHYILLQIITLLFAISCSAAGATLKCLPWMVCFFFVYSVCTALGTALHVFHMTELFDIYVRFKDKTSYGGDGS